MKKFYTCVYLCFFIVFFCHIHMSQLFSNNTYLRPYQTPLLNHVKKIELTENNSGLPGIDCIYVINLDKRIEKWQRVQTLCKERNLNVNRVSAINGWALSDEVRKELAGPYGVRLNGGHTGCLLSHLSVIKDAFDRGFNTIWIMEDDLEFVENVQQISTFFLPCLTSIDPHWDVFYTDTDTRNQKGEHVQALALDPRPDQRLNPLPYYLYRHNVHKDIMRIGQRYGMYSVILSRSGIKKIIRYLSHVHLWTSIDIDIHYVPTIREYASTRDLITHYWCSSSISDTNPSSDLNGK